MKKVLLPALALCLGFSVQAQDVFAINGSQPNRLNFQDFRSIDINNPENDQVVFSRTQNVRVISQTSGVAVQEDAKSYDYVQAYAMAALAYNQKGDQLIFAPMMSNNIYVMDLKSKKVTLVENQEIKTKACSIASHLTRMTTGADGSIYAMDNASDQLIKITNNNGRYSIENLGAIQDDASSSVLIKDMKAGFGGDIIADKDNNLYVFAASGNVFKVNINTKNASFLGAIEGLPEGYTVNGAAVMDNGNVLVGSMGGNALYEVEMDGLAAKPTKYISSTVYDLASNHLLFDENENSSTIKGYADIDIYPTRIKEEALHISIKDKAVQGTLLVEVVDYLGNQAVQQELNVSPRVRSFVIEDLPKSQGVYLVSIKDRSGKTILMKKIIIE